PCRTARGERRSPRAHRVRPAEAVRAGHTARRTGADPPVRRRLGAPRATARGADQRGVSGPTAATVLHPGGRVRRSRVAVGRVRARTNDGEHWAAMRDRGWLSTLKGAEKAK